MSTQEQEVPPLYAEGKLNLAALRARIEKNVDPLYAPGLVGDVKDLVEDLRRVEACDDEICSEIDDLIACCENAHLESDEVEAERQFLALFRASARLKSSERAPQAASPSYQTKASKHKPVQSR